MKWIIFILMLPQLKPSGWFEHLWPSVELLLTIGQVISAIIIIYLHILKNKLPSKPVWIVAIMQGWIILITYLQQGMHNMYFICVKTASMLAIALLIDFFANNMKVLLRALLLNMEIPIYLNLISILLYFPEGKFRTTGPEYFLGQRNGFIVYSLPAIVIALLYIRNIKFTYRPIFLIVASCLPIIIIWSATSICGLITLGVVLLAGKTKIRALITYSRIFIITLVVDLSVSVFRIMDRVLWTAWIIENFLHKQVTLTGRTFVWDSFYSLFSRSPWIGYGANVLIQSSIGETVVHMHNQWFQYLFEGGIPALVIFLALNFVIGKRIMDYNSSNSIIFWAAFTALYVMFISEAYSSPILYMIFPLAYHIDKFQTGLMVKPQKLRTVKQGYHVSKRKLFENS